MMKFKSKLEEWAYKELKKRKLNIEYESERLGYVVRRSYIPDFVVTRTSGKDTYIETKGYFRSEDRTKLCAVKESNPNADIRIVFSQDNKLTKNSKMRYSDWCKKHGFLYAVGEIPKEWFTE